MSTTTPYRYDVSALRDVFERDFTYLAGVRRNSHRFAHSTALSDAADPTRSWTYAELWSDAGRLADALRGHGVAPGDAVVIDLFNSAEFALLWVACQRLGAVATPINFRLSAGEIAHVLNDSRPSAFVFDETLTQTAAEAIRLAEHSPTLNATVGEPAPAAGGSSFDDLLASGDPNADVAPPPESTIYDETTRLYTSGTTGMPKGVSLPSLVEILSAHDVIMHFPLSPQDRTLNMTPWFHRGGLYAGGPNPVFYVGAEAVALRQFDPGVVLDLVAERGLTFLVGAPTNLAMLTAEQRRRPRELSTLHGIVTMGAPLDREACLRYQETLTARIFNGYGTTEAFWNTFLRPGDLPDHAGSAGRACTDDDVAVVRIYEDRLADPSDTVPQDSETVGEVAVRSVKSGYAYVNQPEEQAQRFHDGWLYIGDLATWDADEYVTIVGRKDDMIISGGENVHPTQVEAVLAEHPGVADAAVVGLPDERWGEIVVAYVVADPDSADPVDAAALEAHAHGHPMLATYKRPRRYRFVTELPMTATGKKIHYLVREMVARDAAEGRLLTP